MWPATERFGLRTAPSGLALVQDVLNTDAPAGGVGFPDLLADAGAASSWASAAVVGSGELTDADATRLRAFRETLRSAVLSGTDRPASPATSGPADPAADRPTGAAADHPAGPVADHPAGPAADRPGGPAAGPPAGSIAEGSVAEGRAGRLSTGGGGGVPVEAELSADGGVVLRPAGEGWRYVVSAVLLAVHDAQLTGEWPRLKVCRNNACGTAFYDRSRNSSAVWHDAVKCGNAPNLRASRARRRTASPHSDC